MNGFKCNVTGSTSTVPVAQSKVARRCGADPKNGKPHSVPGNCTYGAKQPYYWFNLERNNVSYISKPIHLFFILFLLIDRCEKLRCLKALFLHLCTTTCTTSSMEHRTTSLLTLMLLYPLHHRTLVCPSCLTYPAPTHPLHQPRQRLQTRTRILLLLRASHAVNKRRLPYNLLHYHQRQHTIVLEI